MVITREAEVFELRDDVQDPSHAQTIHMTQGRQCVYEETVDDVGIAWCAQAVGGCVETLGTTLPSFDMLQKQQ